MNGQEPISCGPIAQCRKTPRGFILFISQPQSERLSVKICQIHWVILRADTLIAEKSRLHS